MQFSAFYNRFLVLIQQAKGQNDLEALFTVNSDEMCLGPHVERQNLCEDPSNDHDLCKMRLFPRF